MNKVRRITGLALAFVLIVAAFAGCSSKPKESEYKSDVSMSALAEEIMGQITFAMTMPIDMTDADASAYITESTGLTGDMVSDSAIHVNMMITADNLWLAEAKDMDGVEAVKAAFEKQLETVTKSFEQYLPEPLEMAKNGKVVTRGRYVMLIISEDNDKAIELFESHIK